MLKADNALPSSSAVTVGASGTLNLNSFNDTIASLTDNGSVIFGTGNTLTTSGAQTYNGTVTGSGISMVSTGGGAITADNSGNSLTGNISVTTTGNASIATSGALSLGAVSAGTFTAEALGGDLTVTAGNQVQVTGTSGDPLILEASGNFINNSGAAALQTGAGGSWLVYSTTPGGDTFGNLNSNNTAIWNTALGAPISQSGDRYVFSYQPALTITFTSTSDSKTYGVNDAAALAPDYTVSGALQAGVANAFLADTYATAFSGAPSVTSSGSAASAAVAGSPYAITVAQGTLASNDGYAFAYVSPGLLTVNPAALTITADDENKLSINTLTFSGHEFTTTGLASGDKIGHVTLTSAGTPSSAASGTYTITPSAATGGTFNLNNYTLSYVNGQLTVSLFTTNDLPDTVVWVSQNISPPGAIPENAAGGAPFSAGPGTGALTTQERLAHSPAPNYEPASRNKNEPSLTTLNGILHISPELVNMFDLGYLIQNEQQKYPQF